MPGTVVGLMPYLLLTTTRSFAWPECSFLTVLTALVAAVGLVFLLQAILGFAVQGKGTLAPVDPPKVLVLRGLYARTRNPMYVAVVTILVAEAIFFRSIGLFVYAGITFIIFNLVVLLYEEPHLRKEFGESYEEYCRSVPRWPIPFGTGWHKRRVENQQT